HDDVDGSGGEPGGERPYAVIAGDVADVGAQPFAVLAGELGESRGRVGPARPCVHDVTATEQLPNQLEADAPVGPRDHPAQLALSFPRNSCGPFRDESIPPRPRRGTARTLGQPVQPRSTNWIFQMYLLDGILGGMQSRPQSPDALTPTTRTALRRLPQRGSY